MPRVITGDGNAAYPLARAARQAAGTVAPEWPLRPVKYRNNRIAQDHRVRKRRVPPGVRTRRAGRTLPGDAALNQRRKGPGPGTTKGAMRRQNRCIAAALGRAA